MIRPPVVTTVIFDFGQTLFEWKGDDRTESAIARGVAGVLGLPAHECARVGQVAAAKWPGIVQRAGYPMGEINLVEAMTEVFAAASIPLGRDAVADLIREEHKAWPGQRVIPPSVYAMLRSLRADGVRIGILSNTIDPIENCHADLVASGIDRLVDASLFSTEIGARKPNPIVYAEMLRRLGNPDPGSVLFVGDRMLEDVTTPISLGMHACLATYFRNENPAARPRAGQPADVVALVRSLNSPGRAIA